MSVIGIDFGTLNSYIAIARNRGVDVITNEVSSRSTSSLVGFSPKQRQLGEMAKTNEMSNFKNTFGNLKRLLGLSNSEEIEAEAKFVNGKLFQDEHAEKVGSLLIETQYLGETQTFSVVQLVAMYLNKLKQIAEAEQKSKVAYCVLSIPCWYTNIQRQQILYACQIADLNCLKLMTETAAASLAYGITKTDLNETPRNVIIIDIGYSTYSVTAASFVKGKLQVKATAYDKYVGGRYIDEEMTAHFAKKIKEKYKIDVVSNKKALYRLRTGCEKAKKILSANSQASINVESIMDDIDVSFTINREEFEEMIQDQTQRIAKPLNKVIEQTNWNINEIHSIELIGGSTRVPCFKNQITQLFNNEIKLSFTLNQDEAVARGCALQCAIQSPVFKVRDFECIDQCLYPIQFSWLKESPTNELSTVEVFDKNCPIPCTKQLTFYKEKSFEINVSYKNNSNLFKSQNETQLLTYTINFNQGDYEGLTLVRSEKSQLPQILVKTRLNTHGIVEIYSAYLTEEIETVQDDGVDESGEKKTVTKTKQKKHELPLDITRHQFILTKDQLDKFIEAENEMFSNDKLAVDTEDARNSIEEYVYDMRAKLSGIYSEYVDPKTKDQFSQDLAEVENWLYEDGENETKSVYLDKLSKLKHVGTPITHRYTEYSRRQEFVREATYVVDNYMKIVNTTEQDPEYGHIKLEQKQQIANRCGQFMQFIKEAESDITSAIKYENPKVTNHQINEQLKTFRNELDPIANQPKPKPKEAPKEEQENKKSQEQTDSAQSEPQEEDQNKEAPNMDID